MIRNENHIFYKYAFNTGCVINDILDFNHYISLHAKRFNLVSDTPFIRLDEIARAYNVGLNKMLSVTDTDTWNFESLIEVSKDDKGNSVTKIRKPKVRINVDTTTKGNLTLSWFYQDGYENDFKPRNLYPRGHVNPRALNEIVFLRGFRSYTKNMDDRYDYITDNSTWHKTLYNKITVLALAIIDDLICSMSRYLDVSLDWRYVADKDAETGAIKKLEHLSAVEVENLRLLNELILNEPKEAEELTITIATKLRQGCKT